MRFASYLYDPNDPDLVSKVQKDIPEFNFTFAEMDKLIKYTVLCYDPHADLLKLFPGDFNRRKAEAAKLAGFVVNEDGRFDKAAEDCMVGANDDYNTALVAFVVKFNVSDLPAYVMYREVFFSEMKAAMAADDNMTDKKTASALRKEAILNAEIARTKMHELEVKLFTATESLEVRSALYVVAEKMRLSLRPEDKAKEIESKTLNVSDPYYGTPKRRGRPRK